MNYASSSVIPSRTSRTTATVGYVNDNYVDTVYSSFFNEFFIIYDELGRSLPQNSILVFFQVFVSIYQFYVTSFLPFLPEKWDYSKFPDKILRYLTYPIDFGLGDTETLVNGVPSYFIILFEFVLSLYLSIIYLYHHFNKMLPKYNIHVIRFILSFVIPVMLSPSCYNIGFSFNSIYESDKSTVFYETNSTNYSNQSYIYQPNKKPYEFSKSHFTASTVFGIIFYLLLLFAFYVDIMLRSSTPYVEITPLSMWDGHPYFLFIIGCSLINLTTRMIERLPSWTDYVLIVCCIMYDSFLLYEMFYFPMIKRKMNVLFSIFLGAGIVASLFQLFPIPSFYRLIIPPCILIILIPVFIIVFRYLCRRIVQQEISDKILRSEKKSLQYLRIAIAFDCEEFISFKWIRLMTNIDNINMISQITKIVALFPSESRNLTIYISLLSKNHQLNFYQRFLVFQARQVQILRQSSTTKQLNDDLIEISKITNRSINSFSQFLIKIVDERYELSLDGLNSLAKINRETNSICNEAMARYPNNSRLLYIFSRYVIECHADYKNGVSLFHEGKMIERGKRILKDIAFQSMVNLFPVYLWKRILNYKGQVILNRKHARSGSSMSADSYSNDRTRSTDLDPDSNEKNASGVIENPKLRFALRKSVTNMNSTGIPILTSNTIIRFIFGAIMCITLMFIFPDLLEKRAVNYRSIAQINIFRKNLDLCLFRTAKLWSWSLGLAPNQDNITKYLDEGITLNDYNNLTVSPYEELFKKVIESVKSNEELGKLLIEVRYKQTANFVGENSESSGSLLHVKNISFCNRKLRKVFEASTSLRYFSLYILNQVSTVSYLNQIYDDPSEWKNDECICEIILNMHNIVSVLLDQSNTLVNRENIYSNTVNNELIIIMAVIIPIVFIVLLIPLIVIYFKILSEFQHIFDVLNLLPIKIYKEASKPIAIFQTEFDQNGEAVTQFDHKGCQKVGILLPAIISIILITGGLAGTLYLYLDVNKQFYTLVRWLETGSLRTPLVIEVVTHNILAGIFGYLGSSDYSSHEHHLSLSYNYSRQLLLQHKSLIYGSNQIKPCYGFNNDLDDLHFANSCALNNKGESLRVNYKCLSLDQQIYTFHKLSKDTYFTMQNAQAASSNSSGFNQNFKNILNDYESINLHFLGISHLLQKLESAQNMLNDGVYLQIDHLKEYSYLVLLLVLGCTFIIFIIELFIINNLKEEFNIIRILIARLPPMSVVKNKQLVELIVGNYNKKKSKQLTPITINIQNCPNSIIIFDNEYKIRLVNTSASKIFGFTKEQLYQSDLSKIIYKEDLEILKDKCKKNQKENDNNQNKKEIELEDIKDDNNDMMLQSLLNNYDDDNINLNQQTHSSTEKIDLCNNPFEKTIIGLKDDGMQIILSAILTYLPEPDDVFALILRDETSIYINREDIKQAKLQANEILNNVLPAQLIQSSRMKENISFSVKQLSVITIKILNFNDTIPHITSVQAVRSMSELFLMFDAQLMNYQTLTKTCVISNSYQAVGGLFNTNTVKSSVQLPENLSHGQVADDKIEDSDIEIESNDDNEDSKRELIPHNSILIDNAENNEVKKEIIVNINPSLIDIEPKKKNKNSNPIDKEQNTNQAETEQINDPNQENIEQNVSQSDQINDEQSTSQIELEQNKESNQDDIKQSAIQTNDNDTKANDNVSQTKDNDNQTNNNDNQTKDNDNQTKVNDNQTKDNDNQTQDNDNQTKVNDNQTKVNDNQTKDNDNQNSSSSEIKNEQNENDNETVQNKENNSEANQNTTDDNNNSNDAKLSQNESTQSKRSGVFIDVGPIINPQNNYSPSGNKKSGFIQGVTSIYNTNLFSPSQSEAISDIILDSIYFAFNCLDATEYVNNSSGTNFVIAIGINFGGPCTAGTLGHEHMQFNVIGEAVKSSFIVCNEAEAGNILITNEIFEQLKESPEALRNFEFEKYKVVGLNHKKSTQTYLTKPSDVFRQERNAGDDNEQVDNNNDNEHTNNINNADNENDDNENDNEDDTDNSNENNLMIDQFPNLDDVPLEQQMNSPDD